MSGYNRAQELYVRNRFWDKVKKTVSRVPFVPDAIAMYYCTLDLKTPIWAKATILAALAYFILPTDAVPDIIPIAGFTDDAGAIAAALAAVNSNLNDEHRQKAKDWLAGSSQKAVS